MDNNINSMFICICLYLWAALELKIFAHTIRDEGHSSSSSSYESHVKNQNESETNWKGKPLAVLLLLSLRLLIPCSYKESAIWIPLLHSFPVPCALHWGQDSSWTRFSSFISPASPPRSVDGSSVFHTSLGRFNNLVVYQVICRIRRKEKIPKRP